MSRPRYLDVAIKVALANDSYPRKRHGAVIVKGGSIQAIGWNARKQECSRHAEVHAIQCAPRQCHGATMYVARVGMDSSPRLSLPCEQCRAAIVESGIKRVVYTIDFLDYGYWKPLTS